MGPRPGESEDDYRNRKRKEKESETPEERAIRKAKEAERDRREKDDKDKRSSRPKETEEERAARKAKEAKRDDKDKRPKETEEERAARKAKEAKRGGDAQEKEKPRETEEERAIRKAKEAERDKREKDDKDKRSSRPKETEEERAARKAKERAREEEKSRKEVVHKQLHHVRAKDSPDVPPPSSSKKPEPKVQIKPDRADEDDDDVDYDEDFEDGFGEDELENVRKALEEENARLLKEAQAKKRKDEEAAAARRKKEESSFAGRRKSRTADSSDDDNDNEESGAKSKFGAGDLQRQKYRAQFDKDLERATALRRLIDLESVSVTIADIAPMSEYDRYIRSFGGAGRTQASVQAPPIEDIVSTEVQADRVHLKAKGSQCPEDLGLFPERLMQQQEQRRMEAAAAAKPGGVAGGLTAASSSEEASTTNGAVTSSTSVVGRKTVDTAALSSFLSRVFPVVRSILDENDQLTGGNNKAGANGEGGASSSTSSPEAAGAPFSSSLSTLGCKLVEGRSVVEVSISPVSPQFVTALYGEHQRPDATLAKYPSIVLVWNINDPKAPERVLICTSTLTTITTSPVRQHIIYGGTASGSVCVWDLREPNYRHKSVAASLVVEGGLATDKVAIRTPSFSTVWSTNDNHENPIRQVQVVGHNAVATSKRDEGEQLISVDSKGTIFYWLVSGGAAAHSDAGAGGGPVEASSPRRGMDGRIGEADHGANFYSSVRLFKSATVSALPASRRGDIVSCVEFFPSDPSQLAVGASQVLHINRFGSLTAPSAYTHHSLYSQVSSVPPVMSLGFGSLDSRVLLASYEDGTLRLFLTEEADPKLIITASSAPLTRVRASPTMKWITFALDAQGTFFVFDHAASEKTAPVHKSIIKSAAGKCTVFDVAQDQRGSDTRVVMGFEGGLLQVHTVGSDGVKSQGPRNEMWL